MQTGVIEPSTVSVAVAVKVTTVPPGPVASSSNVCRNSHYWICCVYNGYCKGGCIRCYLQYRYAEQVTVVGPSGKGLPDAGVQTGVIEPSTVSVAVAVNVTTAPPEPVASATIFAGTVTTGAVVSTTVTVKAG